MMVSDDERWIKKYFAKEKDTAFPGSLSQIAGGVNNRIRPVLNKFRL